MQSFRDPGPFYFVAGPTEICELIVPTEEKRGRRRGHFYSHLIGKISVMAPPNCRGGWDYGLFM